MDTYKFFDHPRHHRTAGVASRDCAFHACVDYSHRASDVMYVIMAGGPLDACDVIPAGSCNSVTYVNWKGIPDACVTGLDRG